MESGPSSEAASLTWQLGFIEQIECLCSGGQTPVLLFVIIAQEEAGLHPGGEDGGGMWGGLTGHECNLV